MGFNFTAFMSPIFKYWLWQKQQEEEWNRRLEYQRQLYNLIQQRELNLMRAKADLESELQQRQLEPLIEQATAPTETVPVSIPETAPTGGEFINPVPGFQGTMQTPPPETLGVPSEVWTGLSASEYPIDALKTYQTLSELQRRRELQDWQKAWTELLNAAKLQSEAARQTYYTARAKAALMPKKKSTSKQKEPEDFASYQADFESRMARYGASLPKIKVALEDEIEPKPLGEVLKEIDKKRQELATLPPQERAQQEQVLRNYIEEVRSSVSKPIKKAFLEAKASTIRYISRGLKYGVFSTELKGVLPDLTKLSPLEFFKLFYAGVIGRPDIRLTNNMTVADWLAQHGLDTETWMALSSRFAPFVQTWEPYGPFLK